MIEWLGDDVLHVRPFLTVTLGILALFAGKAGNERLALLRQYSIPEPVTGGLLFAVAFGLLYALLGVELDFELTARDLLLVYFFTTIGLNARAGDLLAGGRPLAILLAATLGVMILQDLIGTAFALLLGREPAMGLMAGSMSLLGGHGTAIAWAPTLAARGVDRALEAGITCATLGLVLGSVSGGPLAGRLIRRHRLAPATGEAPDVGVRYDEPRPDIDYFGFLRAILAIHVCGMLGFLLQQALAAMDVTLPLFASCLAAAILLTNLVPRVAPGIAWPSHSPALALIAEICLGVFLALSLMAMQPWKLPAGQLVPLLFVLAAQLAAILAFARFVVFPALGRGYDAAVVCAGFVGFGLGATPTAMANMTAITQRYGASRLAFLLVPIVGAFFVDLANTLVIQTFLTLLPG